MIENLRTIASSKNSQTRVTGKNGAGAFIQIIYFCPYSPDQYLPSLQTSGVVRL